jgi:hypothetical protein
MRWAFRLGAVLLLPALVAGAYLVASPVPRVSLSLSGDEYVVGLSPDGNTLVTHDGSLLGNDWGGPSPGTFRIWDLRTGQPGPELEHAGYIGHMGQWFSPDSRLLCVKTDTDVLKVWEVCGGKQLGHLDAAGAADYRACLGFSPDSRLVVLERRRKAPAESVDTELWDVDLRQARATLSGQSSWQQKGWYGSGLLCWAPDGRRFATFHRTGRERIDRVNFYSLADDDPIVRPLVEYDVSGQEFGISPDLDVIATVEADPDGRARRAVTVREVDGGAVLAAGLPFDPESRLGWMGWDRDRRRLTFVGGERGKVFWTTTRTDYDLASGAVVRHEVPGEPDHLSPDLRWMPEEAGPGATDLWDTASGEKRGRLLHHGDVWGGGGRPSFSKDSRFLLVPGLRGETMAAISFDSRPTLQNPIRLTRSSAVGRLWEAETQRELCAFPNCHQGFLSEDGKTVVGISVSNNQVKVWDVPPRRPWGAPLAVGTVLWGLALVTGLAARRAWRRLGSSRPA